MPHLLDPIITQCPSLDRLVENLSVKTTIFCSIMYHLYHCHRHHDDHQKEDKDQSQQTSSVVPDLLLWSVCTKGDVRAIIVGVAGI